jgi:hypothetical protein
MKVTSCSVCDGFSGYVKDLKIWDTYREVESLKKFSRTDFTYMKSPGVIAYWKFIYEVGCYGRCIYDYSNNGNSEVDISSGYSWGTPA